MILQLSYIIKSYLYKNFQNCVQYYAMFDNNATRGELAKLYNAEQVKLKDGWVPFFK